MEPHAPKGQGRCTKRERLSDEQPRELCIRLDPNNNIACWVEDHERQQAAAKAGAGAEAQAQVRMLLSQIMEAAAGAGTAREGEQGEG